jgi:hypothetical protein
MTSCIRDIVDAWQSGTLKAASWASANKHQHCLQFKYRVREQSFQVFVDVDEEIHYLGLFMYAPVNAPTESRDRVTELVIRLNRRLRIGNFDLD